MIICKQFKTVYTIIIGLNTIQNGNRHSTKQKGSFIKSALISYLERVVMKLFHRQKEINKSMGTRRSRRETQGYLARHYDQTKQKRTETKTFARVCNEEHSNRMRVRRNRNKMNEIRGNARIETKKLSAGKNNR